MIGLRLNTLQNCYLLNTKGVASQKRGHPLSNLLAFLQKPRTDSNSKHYNENAETVVKVADICERMDEMSIYSIVLLLVVLFFHGIMVRAMFRLFVKKKVPTVSYTPYDDGMNEKRNE